MILEELTLHNFCVYSGEQTLDLRPATRSGKNRPIVLFGGINGGGKTTILDAIQLVLYGSRAKCSKQSDKSYEEFLRNSINRAVTAEEGASIRLAFRYASDGEQNVYDVIRRWGDKRGKIKEEVIVRKNGVIDRWLSENWHQQVEDLLPNGIAQLCFFDAEKVRFLAEDETSSQTLGAAIKSLLGLDLAERLISDTFVLETRLAKRVKPSAELTELESLTAELEAKQNELQQIMQERAGIENPRLAAERRMKDAELQFQKTGGEHWLARQTRQLELGGVEEKLRECHAQLLDLAEGELPLALVQPMLQQLSDLADSESTAHKASLILEVLTKRDKQLIAHLKKREIGEQLVDAISSFLDSDRDARAKKSESKSAFEISKNAALQLGLLLSGGLTSRNSQAKALLESAETLTRKSEDLSRAIAAAPKDDGIRQIAEELKNASAELALLDQQAKKLDVTIDSLRFQRNQIEQKVKKIRRKVVDEEIGNEEDARLAELLQRTQKVMSTFLQKATRNKIDGLSDYVTEAFRFLLRKKALVNRVCIDPTTFAITLEDTAGNMIPKQRLSEGEKQIFAIAVLWGLSRASARPLPAIVDTPMGRLDSEHRHALVTRYFPHASHQIVVLSTDTEIDSEAFQKLEPYLARAFHLDYDEKLKQTIAREGYFWEPVSAGK